MPDSVYSHILLFLSGSTALGLVAHAVNTFPTPQNKYGAWFLGLIQFMVGQRVAAKNTFSGMDTMAVPVAKEAVAIAVTTLEKPKND